MNKKNILLLVLLTIFGLKSYSYDFEVDGLYYNILSSNQVEITYKTQFEGYYDGEIRIPSTVNYNGVEYQVVSIGSYAFWKCTNMTGSLAIPNSVETIGSSAFLGCSGLTGTLTISDSVTSIGSSAFRDCSGLTGSLTIPNSVETIGNFAFQNCSGFTGLLILSNSISTIKYGAFNNCTGLTGSLIIPSSVTTIETSAFEGCSGLEGPLVIPQNVTTFNNSAFYNCEKLSLVRSKINNRDHIGIDGSIFEGISSNAKLEVPQETLYYYKTTSWSLHFKNIVAYSNDDYYLTIVTNDNGDASYNNSIVRNQIKTFTVTEGSSAIITFSPDLGYRIKSVKVNGTDVTASLSNNAYTISSISSDTSVVVEFEAKPSTTYTLSIKSTGNGSASYDGTSVRGKTSTFIVNEGISATITFTPDNGYRIKSVKVNTIDMTSSVVNNQYTVDNIKENLNVDVTFGSLSVGDLFYAETVEGVLMTFKVTDAENKICQVGNDSKPAIDVSTTGIVTIPAEANGYKVNAIGKKAFWNTYFYVNRFILPEGITSIGNWAFYQESSLLEMINIPSSVQTIGDRAFANCTHLSYVYITDIKSWCNISFEGVWSNPLCYAGCLYLNDQKLTDLQIPEGVTKLNPSTFIYYTMLNSVTLPSSLSFIGDEAFEYCKNLSAVISNINAPFSISENVFSGISSSAVLQVPQGTKSSYQKYSGWTKCFAEIVEEAPTTYSLSVKASGNGNVSYDNTTIKNQTQTFTVNEGASATLTIAPDLGYRIASVKVNGTDVTSSVVNNQYTISNISSDTSVEVVFGMLEFELNGLNYRAIPNTENVKVIGKTSTYTGAIVIPESASYQGKSYCVKIIEDDAFNSCKDITSVSFPNTLSDVYEGAFYGCNNIETVYTPSIKAWCNIEFENSSANPLFYAKHFIVNGNEESEIVIDEGIEWIRDFAFAEYVGITSVTLPSTLKILDRAFVGCVNLELVISKATTPPSVEDYAWRPFSRISEKAILQVPKGTKSAYLSIPAWSNNFKEIVEESEFYVLSIKATGNGSVTYSGTSVREKTSTFTVEEGTSATLTIAPDLGYRIASVKVNGTDVTSSVVNNRYTINNITTNTTVEVVFEVIPPTTYSLSIKATGSGGVTYGNTTIKNQTQTFTVEEGVSATLTIAPDLGYRIASVKVNGTDVTSSVVNSRYTINNITTNTTVEVVFEVIPPTTYSLSIKTTGSGGVTYGNTTIKNQTQTFTVEEGTSATITFIPDNGYRVKSVKVNNVVVTSNIVDNQYTISNISGDTSVEVEFEVIPSYTLKITSIGNGYATYNGTAVRSGSNTFTVLEGTSVAISLTADDGYRIKSVKVNNQDVTASVNNNRYIINNISANTTVEITFEIIPPTTYTLSITATGNGSVTYGETTMTNQTQQFTVNEGSYATIGISPESGYRIKSVLLNGTDVTANVSDNQYTTSKISSNVSLEVTFELIPIPTYTLKITASGNGTAIFNTETVKNKTQQFTVNEGTGVSVTFNPDNGNSVGSVKVNGVDVTSKVTGNRYIIEGMAANTTIEVVFKEDVNALTVKGVNFTVTSQSDKSIIVAGGNYGQVLEVPAIVTQDGTTWTVKGIDNDALKNNAELAAIIWNAEAAFTATVSNPNLLLYVKSEEYAPGTIKNVIVNGIASNITLMDASSGNSFYCPQAFMAQKISYTHYYSMTTGIGESRGWESIALPFDVQTVTHASKGTIVPFSNWKRGDAEKPFWLYELTGNGFMTASSIKAYTPYIISMPNNPQYDSKWLLNGSVTFAASSVTIGVSDDVQAPTYKDRTFTPCFSDKAGNEGLYALNVKNDYSSENGGSPEGSRFVLNLRRIHPFEAYMTTVSGSRLFIDIFDDMATDIEMIMIEDSVSEKESTIYDLKGHKINKPSKKGVYIINGKKQIIK